MEQESRDLTKFDRSLSGLFRLLETIIKIHEKHELNLSSRKNPFLSRLEKYIKIYDLTRADEHLWYFQKIYDDFKPAILRGPERDTWIRNGNIVIHFGEETRKPIRDAKVHLSSIYKTACTIRDRVEESLHGLPNVEQSKEILFPTILLLHLYRIFHEIANSDKEKETLNGYVKDLEKDTGVGKKTKSSGSDNGLDGLMKTVTGFAEQMGIKMPDGKMPSSDDLNKAMSEVINKPQTKNFLGNMLQKMQGCKNAGDMVGTLLNELPSAMDPAAKESLAANIENAASALGGQESDTSNISDIADTSDTPNIGDEPVGYDDYGEDEFLD
jgi:hypothetical protein